MMGDVQPQWSPQRVATDIARRIAQHRDGESLPPERLDAIRHLETYSALLANASEQRALPPRRRYMFQLELPQGGWDLVEAELTAPPQPGETIPLPRVGAWQVQEQRAVRRRTNSPDHQLFVCRPAAA
jgi:hypothetical protein